MVHILMITNIDLPLSTLRISVIRFKQIYFGVPSALHLRYWSLNDIDKNNEPSKFMLCLLAFVSLLDNPGKDNNFYCLR